METQNENNKKKDEASSSGKKQVSSGHNIFLRIFAIIGVIAILCMYILSLIAVFSGWENKDGIFMGALATTIFFPIVIYLVRLFSNKDQ